MAHILDSQLLIACMVTVDGSGEWTRQFESPAGWGDGDLWAAMFPWEASSLHPLPLATASWWVKV
jgi:hypothetical protein